MIVNVWLIYKAGEPRVYTSSYQPADDQAACFRRDGFELYRVEVALPVNQEVEVLRGKAKKVESVDGEKTSKSAFIEQVSRQNLRPEPQPRLSEQEWADIRMEPKHDGK